VASRVCGLHAQVFSFAELAAWARVEGLKRDAVAHALWEDRTLIKMWAMRGTLHLLPAAELPVWHGALASSRHWLKPAGWRKFGLTVDQLDRLTDAVATALDGRLLTREELAVEVQRITGLAGVGDKIANNSWGTILRPAAFSGHLCFGPSQGQFVRFTRPDSWLAAAGKNPAPPLEPLEAEASVARRFLAAFGPATDHDLARWWNCGVVKARQWIGLLRDEVMPVDVERTRAWMLRADAAAADKIPSLRSVRLLPGFDQYVVAASYHARKLLHKVPRGFVYRQQGWIAPVLLVNGFMHGTWRHEIKGNSVEVSIEPFAKVPAWARPAAGEEAERLAAFLGASLGLSWSR